MVTSGTFCSYYDQQECQSCKWLGTSYPVQLQQKETLIKRALSHFPSFKLDSTVPSAQQGFRNKAKLSVTGTTEKPILGLTGFSQGTKQGLDKIDQGREILACPIHHPKLNEMIGDLPQWITRFNLIPYQIENRSGELKSVILFYSPLSDEMYLRFVLRSKECVSRIRKLLPELLAKFPSLKSVSANIQPIPHAILEGPEEIFITDQKFIHHTLGALTLQLAPQAFVQTNVEVATKLYQTAADWIAEIKPKRMLELFCGQGPFSFFAAKSSGQILGLEINAEAVETANKTAQALRLSHLNFRCVDVANAEGEIQNANADLILVNPPRRGLGKEGLEQLLKQPAKHLFYSSCSVESLEKDAKALAATYQLQRAQIFDLFPHTEHFETLVHFTKK